MPSFSSEERQLLNDSLVDFGSTEYSFDHWRKLAREQDAESFGHAEWAKYAELGWLGATVALTGVALDGTAKLGEGERDMSSIIDEVLDRGVIAVCAEAVGAMAAVTQMTVDYLKTRQQFGQSLAKFQVLQHRLVDMSVASEEARAIVHTALQALDDGARDAQRAVWHAKVQTAKSARFVGGQAIQLHGGMGMTDELAIGHYYKRLCMCETQFGDGEWYLKQLGAAVSAR